MEPDRASLPPRGSDLSPPRLSKVSSSEVEQAVSYLHPGLDQNDTCSYPRRDAQKSDVSLTEPEQGTHETNYYVMSQDYEASELWKGKRKEGSTFTRNPGPLKLLDLPLDILRQIIKDHTPSTNDLCALALTHSALHSVVTPFIYSRFDIVWPDALTGSEPRVGVDALTHGLATLVMREDLFQGNHFPESKSHQHRWQNYSCTSCGMINYVNRNDVKQRGSYCRRGNCFSEFTRKLALSNGPNDWVQEYLVTKESGKMLGTLVALALARMPNLETFFWDMPTGILRDIWTALSSLGDHRPCKLDKVWIRFHNNKASLQEAGQLNTANNPQPPQQPPAPFPPGSNTPVAHVEDNTTVSFNSNHYVERPSFSKVPPLRSLTVLAIDEVSYLDEMAFLIERSYSKLRELRIGLAPNLSTSGHARDNQMMMCLLGNGAIAMLMRRGYFYSLASWNRTPKMPVPPSPLGSDASSNMQSSAGSAFPRATVPDPNIAHIDPALAHVATPSAGVVTAETGPVGAGPISPSEAVPFPEPTDLPNMTDLQQMTGDRPMDLGHPIFKMRLKLETLEMERFNPNFMILGIAIDWSILTTLTLLQCKDTDKLWAHLKNSYTVQNPPTKRLPGSIPLEAPAKDSTQPRLRRMPASELRPRSSSELRLNLKRIHTDSVSESLLSFIKETLAPNTLEWLFLQDRAETLSRVTIDAIFKGPIRRHRTSLTKLSIDSSNGRSAQGNKKWMFNRDIITFITSGKICKLRELGMVVDYKDWHFLLRRLPQVPHIRSLYFPCIPGHVYENGLNARDMATGVIDVISLRPEIELCYLAISTKCFEIVERKPKPGRSAQQLNDTNDSEDDNDDEDDDEDATAPSAAANAAGAEESQPSSEEDEGLTSGHNKDVRVKLREILFYDDKIPIFKARHGRL